MVALQLLRYLVRIWEDAQKQLKPRPLPSAIPLVVYHGVGAWSVPVEFDALLGDIPDALHQYVPSFNFVLVDLGSIEDEALSSNLRVRLFLKTLKYILRGDLPERIGDILKDAAHSIWWTSCESWSTLTMGRSRWVRIRCVMCFAISIRNVRRKLWDI